MDEGGSGGEVTRLLDQWAMGDTGARERLLPLVYGELRALAGGFMRRERDGHTLQPTALVNEVVLRLFRQREIPREGKQPFMGLVAQLMRRVLVDHARERGAGKRGGGATRVTWSEQVPEAGGQPSLEVLDLDRTLERLAALDPRQARVMEMRIFGGFDVDEVAEALGISTATVKRDWATGKAWLYRELSR